MGEVIRFPEEHGLTRVGKLVDANSEPATVIILPVIRIDRGDEPTSGDREPQTGTGKRKRRRAAR